MDIQIDNTLKLNDEKVKQQAQRDFKEKATVSRPVSRKSVRSRRRRVRNR